MEVKMENLISKETMRQIVRSLVDGLTLKVGDEEISGKDIEIVEK